MGVWDQLMAARKAEIRDIIEDLGRGVEFSKPTAPFAVAIGQLLNEAIVQHRALDRFGARLAETERLIDELADRVAQLDARSHVH